MKVIVAGASHGVPEFDRACTSILICSGDNAYYVDGGADISYLLTHYGVPHKNLKGVFITHGHSDHVDGLPAFCDQLMWFNGFDECVPTLFLPDEITKERLTYWIKPLTALKYKRRETVNMEVYSAGEIFNDGVLKVVAIKNKHTDCAYSFYMECEGKKLFFTGDLGYGFGEYLENLGDRHYDVVFCEGAHHDPGTVNEMLKKTPTDKLVIHHLNPEREVELKKLPGTTPFECQIAYDGLTVEL